VRPDTRTQSPETTNVQNPEPPKVTYSTSRPTPYSVDDLERTREVLRSSEKSRKDEDPETPLFADRLAQLQGLRESGEISHTEFKERIRALSEAAELAEEANKISSLDYVNIQDDLKVQFNHFERVLQQQNEPSNARHFQTLPAELAPSGAPTELFASDHATVVHALNSGDHLSPHETQHAPASQQPRDIGTPLSRTPPGNSSLNRAH
jgi:hypothetical protein